MLQEFDTTLSWFTLIAGVYFLVLGIIRKGSIYRNDFPKAIQAEVKRTISITSIIEGVILIAVGLLDVFKMDQLKWLNISLWALGFIIVIVTIVYFRRKYKDYLG